MERRGEQPWAGLGTSCPRAENLIHASPVAHSWPISSREGQGLHSFDSPQGLRPSLPRSNQQRASASLGHQCRARARHLQQPVSTGIKNLLHRL